MVSIKMAKEGLVVSVFGVEEVQNLTKNYGTRILRQ